MTTALMEKHDTTYNGWTNWETWNVALHLDNDQGSQTYWKDRASNWLAISEKTELFTKEEQAAFDLSDEMKEELDTNMCEYFPELEKLSGFYLDLLNGALREVNWLEIAKHYISDVIEEAEYQSKKGKE